MERKPDLTLEVWIEDGQVDAELNTEKDVVSVFSTPIISGTNKKLDILATLALELIEAWSQIEENVL